MSPEIIRTRWADGAMGALLGAAGGGGAMLAVLNPLVDLRFENHNTFWHCGQWFFGVLNAGGVQTQAWIQYQEYLNYMDAANHSLIIPSCFTLTTTSAIAGALILGWRFGKPRNSLVYLRGGKVLRGEAALEVAAASFKKGEAHGLVISPNFAVSHVRERAHWLLAGGTGSGKSVVLWNLSYAAWKRGDRCLIIDYKGFSENWFGQLGKDTLILNVCDARSAPWAICKDVTTLQSVRDLWKFLVPSEAGSNEVFSLAAQQLGIGCTMKLINEQPRNWSFRQLSNLLNLDQEDLKKIMQEHFPEGARAVAEAGKMTDGVLMNLSAYTSVIHDLAAAWGPQTEGFSVRAWIKNPNSKFRTVIMQINTQYKTLSDSFNSCVLAQITSVVSELPDVKSDKNPIWLIADEFPQLSKNVVGGWGNFLVVGRSKGLRVVMAVQSKSQLNEMTNHDISSSWIDSIGTKILCNQDGEGAVWVEKMTGETVYSRPNTQPSSNGVGTTTVWSQQSEPTFKEHQVRSELGDHKTGVRVLVHGFKTKNNVKIQNYFTKFFGEFGSVESHPVELLVDFPFPKLGKKDGTPLRAQFIPADFCKEPEIVGSNKPILNIDGGSTPSTAPELQKIAEAEAEIVNEAVKNYEAEFETMPLILPDFAEVEQKKEEAENEIVEKEAENIAIAIVGAGIGEAIHFAENIDELLEAARDEATSANPLSQEPPLKKRKIFKKKLEQEL